MTSSIHKKLNFPALIAALLLVVLIGFYTVSVYHYEYSISFERESVSIAGYQKNVVNNFNRKVDFYRELEIMSNRRYFIRMEMVMLNLQHSTPEEVSALLETESIDEYEMDGYQLDKNGKLISQFAHGPLTLSESELEELLEKGTLISNNRCYLAEEISNGNFYVIAMDTDFSFSESINFDLSKVVSYIIWNQETGTVQDSKQCQQQTFALSDLNKEVLTKVDGISIGRVVLDGKNYLTAFSTLNISGTDLTVCVYHEEGNSQRKAVFCAGCSGCIVVLCLACCLFLLLRLRKKAELLDRSEHTDSNPRISYKRQVKAVVVGTVVICWVVSFFLFFIQNVFQINAEINTAFRNLSQMEESHVDNQNIIYEEASKSCTNYVEDIAAALNVYQISDIDGWLKEIATILDAEEISIYDANGIIVHSTGPYKGYKLSTRETDTEYPLWQILNSEAKKMICYSSEDDITYVATRRTDEIGILVLRVSGASILTLLEKSEFADLLKLQDYPDTSKFYFTRSDPKTLYILESDNTTAKSTTNVLPLPEEGAVIIGMGNINGQDYLYINSGSTDWATVFAYPVQELLKDALLYAILSCIAYGLIAFILLFSFKKKSVPDCDVPAWEEGKFQEFNEEEKLISKIIPGVISITSLILLTIGCNITGGTTIFTFFSCLEKGLNLITLFFAILSAFVCLGLVLLISALNTLAGKALSPKGCAISGLVSALLKIILGVSFLVLLLEQLGVNTVAIASSLGLAGLSLSIGSKDMVSDLLAGMTLAFEGQIQLGDFVQVNGFSGKVVSLGLCSALLKAGNKEMLVKNSNLKNVLNYSRGLNGVAITVVLPFDTDLDKLKQLIEESEQRFSDACDDNLIQPLRFAGVNKATSYGMECSFKGSTTYEKTGACTSSCTTELMKLLQENDIHPAVGRIAADS